MSNQHEANIIEVDADSLDDARAQVRARLKEGHAVFKEEVLADGKPTTIEGIADTEAAAYANAEAQVPPGAKIQARTTRERAHENTLRVEADDETSARALAPEGHGLVIREVSLVVPGKKGFLGIGKKTPAYEIRQLQRAVVSITYTRPARLRCQVGSRFERLCGSPITVGHTEGVKRFAFSPDGRTAASISYDRSARLWSLDDGRQLRQFRLDDIPTDIAFAPDGLSLACVSGGKLHVWEVESGKTIALLTGAGPCLTFASTGTRVLSGDMDGTIRIWDIRTQKQLQQLGARSGAASSLAVSPDDLFVVSADHKGPTVRLWDLQTGKQCRELAGNGDGVCSLAFSPDARYVASGGYDKMIHLWEADTGREVGRFRGHEDFVHCVAFSRDSQLILSGSGCDGFPTANDNTVRLWSISGGKELGKFAKHRRPVYSVGFAKDPSYALSGSIDKNIYAWRLPTTVLATAEGEFSSCPTCGKVRLKYGDEPLTIFRCSCGHTYCNECSGGGLVSFPVCPVSPYHEDRGRIGSVPRSIGNASPLEREDPDAGAVRQLHEAAQQGNSQKVLELLAAGVSADSKRLASEVVDDSITALYWAAEKGNADVVRLLVAAAANINATCRVGRTPLYMAVLRNNLEVARLLIEAGADINRRAMDDFTPLGRAMDKGFAECASLLRDRGARI